VAGGNWLVTFPLASKNCITGDLVGIDPEAQTIMAVPIHQSQANRVVPHTSPIGALCVTGMRSRELTPFAFLLRPRKFLDA
jgi:hypothetical protein